MKTSYENFINPQPKKQLRVEWKKIPRAFFKTLLNLHGIFFLLKVLSCLFFLYIIFTTNFMKDHRPELEKVAAENLRKIHPDNPPKNVRIIWP